MLKEVDINNINNAFKKINKKRDIICIYDTGDRYILATKDRNDDYNLDPYYLYNKKNGSIVHSSVFGFLEFNKMLSKAMNNVVWEE